MPDWSASMQRTYEYYVVDPITWKDKRRLNNVKSCSINRDLTAETLGSATIDIDETINECYIRVYLITIQNGVTEKFPLGTFLAQTPSLSVNSTKRNISADCYTPLIELKENPPPLGYSILKGSNIMENAYRLIRENARAPVVRTDAPDTLFYDFVADPSDTWSSYLTSLIANAKYSFDLDDLGRIIFAPKQKIASLQPVWTYNDDNSSILYPEVSMDRDLFGIPNVVEVIYSNGTDHFYARAVNDDPNSLTSTVSRGRMITKRDTNPNIMGSPSQKQVDEYAIQLLEELSSLECKVTYKHGYCPVRPGDCIRLNYSRADLSNIKAKVISQNINCTSECSVTETAVYTMKFWG